jgi:hypothetical protein
MNVHMWENPLVQANLAKLRAAGQRIIEPGVGFLACGYEGAGRLADPGVIVAEVERAVAAADLAGARVLVTAGPNREPIDPVRFISNRSTGRMGYAVAAAQRRGADVTDQRADGDRAAAAAGRARHLGRRHARAVDREIDAATSVHGRRGGRLAGGAVGAEAQEAGRAAAPRAGTDGRYPR